MMAEKSTAEKIAETPQPGVALQMRNTHREEVSTQFGRYWKGRFKSRGIKRHNFTRRSRPMTPFLEEFIDQLPFRPGLSVVEGGMGKGAQACRIVREIHRIKILYGLETSKKALGSFRKTVSEQPQSDQPRLKERLMPVNMDILQFLRDWNVEEQGYIDGFYANSVLHFFTGPDRREVYDLLREKMAPDGVMAVSFKTVNDVLAIMGEIMDSHTTEPAGDIIRDKEDGIERLFVRDFQTIVSELCGAGWELVEDPIIWNVNGYNIPGKEAEFVGFIVRKKVLNGVNGHHGEDSAEEE